MEQKLIGGLEQIAGRRAQDNGTQPAIVVKVVDEPNEVAANTTYATLFDGKTQVKAIFLLSEPVPFFKNGLVRLLKYSYSKNGSILIVNSAEPAPSHLGRTAQKATSEQEHQPQKQAAKVEVPIRVLNSFLFAEWQITARAFEKSDLKHFTNFRGEDDMFFTVDFVDKFGDEIRASVSGKDLCDKFYDTLTPGNVYKVSGCAIRPANKDFTPISHNFEVSIGAHSEVVLTADNSTIPRVAYHFVKISEIATCESGTIIDVIGVVSKADEPQTVRSKKSGKDLIKRTITLFDSSLFSVELTLWGALVDTEHTGAVLKVGAIVAAKWCRVSSFNTRSLSATFSTRIEIAPETPEASRLHRWLSTQRNITSLSLCPLSVPLTFENAYSSSANNEVRTIENMRSTCSEMIERGEEMDLFCVWGIVSYIRHDTKISYHACLTPRCGAKVCVDDSGMYFCQKCGKRYDTCEERFIIMLRISDFTGSVTATAFNNTGEVIMGISAKRLNEVRREYVDSDQMFERYFKDATYKCYTLRVKPRLEMYHEEQRIRYTIVSAKPINYAEESKRLITTIKKFT